MRTRLILLLMPLWLLSGCETEDSEHGFSFNSGDTLIVTLNSGQSETLSLINLNNDELLQHAVGTGRVPNDMLFLRDTLYLLNSDQQSISIYTMTPEPVYLREIELGDQSINLNPWNIATDGRWLWVTCFLQDQLLRVDPADGQQQAFNTGSTPQAVLCHDGLVLVGNTSYRFCNEQFGEGSVTILDGESGDSLGTVPVDTNPQGLLLTPAGNLGVMCTGDYTDSGTMLELSWGSWELLQRREMNCDPLDACFQGELLTVAAGGWDTGVELCGIVCQLDWNNGEWIHPPSAPIVTHRGAIGLLPLQSGLLVACYGSGRVDRFNAAGTMIADWPAGDGVQDLLQRAASLVN